MTAHPNLKGCVNSPALPPRASGNRAVKSFPLRLQGASVRDRPPQLCCLAHAPVSGHPNNHDNMRRGATVFHKRISLMAQQSSTNALVL
jgi:hypothetical protein